MTDNAECCRGSDNPNGGGLGEWYFPDGTLVPTGNTNSIYRNRDLSAVRLNRMSTVEAPTGIYRCEVPDASGTTQSVSVGLYLGIIQLLQREISFTHCFSSPLVPTPTNFQSSSQNVTSITLSWSLPSGNVDSFEIAYTYQGGCSGYTQPENMATVNDGTAREYALQNLQEFSDYDITITALNGADESASVITTATTLSSG